jgi:hypothetical protein
MTRKWGKVAQHVLPEFDALRSQPPHALLAALHRGLIMELSGYAGTHYEGLTQAGRDDKLLIGGQMASKMRVIDEAAHLLRHISPESCSIYVGELRAALQSHSVNEGPASCNDSGSAKSSASEGTISSMQVGAASDEQKFNTLAERVAALDKMQMPVEVELDSVDAWFADQDPINHTSVADPPLADEASGVGACAQSAESEVESIVPTFHTRAEEGGSDTQQELGLQSTPNYDGATNIDGQPTDAKPNDCDSDVPLSGELADTDLPEKELLNMEMLNAKVPNFQALDEKSHDKTMSEKELPTAPNAECGAPRPNCEDVTLEEEKAASCPRATLPQKESWADVSDDDATVAITDAGCSARQRKSAAQRRIEKRVKASAKNAENEFQRDSRMLKYM